ncbi:MULTISPECIES: Maf family protein [unclassified Sulfitobacter]|uniref:Maf family protein n=1 Tax=unclassified Sulfitobacter TaxID=196795 RepID=UPI0007C2D3F6|nr:MULTISPECIES: Maf family protein [unclassified Sulfitobacter]KZY06019.1 septum formation protein Maf [Sulfitobacter sp. HI0023]KZY27583.1 septum formation protein Maf [Sulfitobacter sp. HI0040]KZZ67921.1 septum formation protein Maf [Sulfitobacter sp. HI0129]
MFILGSGSPRRKELLAQIGVVPDEIRAPDIDESPLKQELPRPYCARMAREKAAAVPCTADDIVLCADTTVALGRRILGKPEDAAEAERFLRLMSGRRHKVITAVCVKRGEDVWERDVQSTVQMKVLSDNELRGYLATGDWQGKAGGYGIQGPAGALIPWISGSFTGIVGLPLAETAGLLEAAGVATWGRPQ